MDPSIIKLLDEEEDETMHSGADVEAFTAALNRDIQGDNPSTSQPPTTSAAAAADLYQVTSYTPSQLFQQWKSSKLEEEIKAQIQEQQSSVMEVDQHGSGSESPHLPNGTSRDITHVPSEPSGPQDDQHKVLTSQATNVHNTDKKPAQKMQRMDNQQAANATNQPSGTGRQVPFGLLLPVIQPQLDKDRAMQLMGLYNRLKNNDIRKEEFVRQMKALVGDHMLKMALYKSQQANHMSSNGSAIKQQQQKQQQQANHMNFPQSMNKPEPRSITAQLERPHAFAGSSSLVTGSNEKTPPKNPSVGQKNPLEAPVSPLSKKQKVTGAFSDQSIEQLNDVTAVSGVNLREEEEQLLSGSKEDNQVSEASRKAVQEEEERLFLQKIPLQKKVAEIKCSLHFKCCDKCSTVAKCGVKNISSDVEQCLSLCVEERMRGLISNLIQLSKQRFDIEKTRHRTVITSDIRQQIILMNQKAREEWEKKQADAGKLQRMDEPEGSDDVKSSKVNKEEDDKMRTSAANVAARVAVGGDDVYSKWQLMAEQARQKREGEPGPKSVSQPSFDAGPKPMSTLDRNFKDNLDLERASGSVIAKPGPLRKSLRNQDLQRSISVKDMISVLGREIQMSRSTLIYCLYEKLPSEFAGVIPSNKD